VRSRRRRSGFICVRSLALRDFLIESFDRFQLAGLALVCLKNETKADAERDLRELISTADAAVAEKALAKVYRATWNLRIKHNRWNWQSTAWSELARLLRRWTAKQ